ncbi:MAG: RNA 2',3'-cyclic phosphodiesterase [Synergistaceae bacterium]|nr:RNA 2',3'-cyclic phosphodiesterase [Synergistaceae bacterium]
MNKLELIRAFVAVKMPDEVSEELENFLSEVRPLANIRWVRFGQFHITLKFLGELEANVIARVKKSLAPLKYFTPFKINLSYIGAFPNLNSPRVIWLSGDEGARELSALSRRVNDVLYDDEELPKDEKKFKAHLTLARLKNGILSEELVRKLGTVKNFSWQCDELFLMRSELTTKGPIYTELL